MEDDIGAGLPLKTKVIAKKEDEDEQKEHEEEEEKGEEKRMKIVRGERPFEL